MTWNLNSERPIYAQIIERIQLDIIAGRYQAGEKLPSVRDLASEAAVNPNTMQKALSELERAGLVYTQRTSGRFITGDTNMIKKTKEEVAAEQIRSFIEKIRQLGLDPEETIQMLQKMIKEEKTQ